MEWNRSLFPKQFIQKKNQDCQKDEFLDYLLFITKTPEYTNVHEQVNV